MSKYYIEYGALQANGKRLIECETSALDAKKITEDFAREIADALNGREAWKQEKAEIEANALAVGGIVEAARTADKSSAVGNTASIRKALETMTNLFEQGVICTSYANSAEEMEQIEELYRKAKSALSAPARNCDLYATRHEMSMAYEAYRKSDMKSYGNGLTGRVPTIKQKPMTYDEWIFATVERKGEDDYA